MLGSIQTVDHFHERKLLLQYYTRTQKLNAIGSGYNNTASRYSLDIFYSLLFRTATMLLNEQAQGSEANIRLEIFFRFTLILYCIVNIRKCVLFILCVITFTILRSNKYIWFNIL